MPVHLSAKQLRILQYLATHEGWSMREDMVETTGRKGFSKALGASTKQIRPDSLLGLHYVEQRDMTRPFKYRITDTGSQAIAEHRDEHGELRRGSVAPRKPTQPQLTSIPTDLNAATPVEQKLQGVDDKISLEEFERTLHELIDEDHPNWPFLCQGSPFECEVAVVGINPGTNIPLWPFWSLPYGCNREGWVKTFWQLHKGDQKPTRKRMNILFDFLRKEPHPIKCIEMNLYPYYSPSIAELAPPLKDVRVFEYLLTAIKPSWTAPGLGG